MDFWTNHYWQINPFLCVIAWGIVFLQAIGSFLQLLESFKND